MSTRVTPGRGCGTMWPMSKTTSKTNGGNFFEDFTLGQVIEHATPRTIRASRISSRGR